MTRRPEAGDSAASQRSSTLLVHAADDDGGFHGPSIDEFFPPAILFDGTPFEINRIMLIRFLAVVVARRLSSGSARAT